MGTKTSAQREESRHSRHGAGTEDRDEGPAQSAHDVRSLHPSIDKRSHLPLKLLRFNAVRERTGLSRSTVWRLEGRGAFPKHT